MGPLDVTGATRLLPGLATGVAFDFILQTGQMTRYDRIVSFFRLTDLSMLKVMMGGILSGMVAVYGLHALGLVNLHVKPTVLAANILGGLVFGAGMLLLGFRPGTWAGAFGEGRMDGLLRGVLGMLLGAAVCSEVYPFIKDTLLRVGDFGKLTLPGLLGVTRWVIIVPLVAVCGAALAWLDRRGS